MISIRQTHTHIFAATTTMDANALFGSPTDFSWASGGAPPNNNNNNNNNNAHTYNNNNEAAQLFGGGGAVTTPSGSSNGARDIFGGSTNSFNSATATTTRPPTTTNPTFAPPTAAFYSTAATTSGRMSSNYTGAAHANDAATANGVSIAYEKQIPSVAAAVRQLSHTNHVPQRTKDPPIAAQGAAEAAVRINAPSLESSEYPSSSSSSSSSEDNNGEDELLTPFEMQLAVQRSSLNHTTISSMRRDGDAGGMIPAAELDALVLTEEAEEQPKEKVNVILVDDDAAVVVEQEDGRVEVFVAEEEPVAHEEPMAAEEKAAEGPTPRSLTIDTQPPPAATSTGTGLPLTTGTRTGQYSPRQYTARPSPRLQIPPRTRRPLALDLPTPPRSFRSRLLSTAANSSSGARSEARRGKFKVPPPLVLPPRLSTPRRAAAVGSSRGGCSNGSMPGSAASRGG